MNTNPDKFKGVIVPAAVPIRDDYSIDREGLVRHISFLLDSGVHGIFANGSMGAFALLSDRSQYEAIEVILETVAGRVPVLAGASDTSTLRVLEKTNTLQGSQIAAVVVLPPFYYVCTQREIQRFYETVAEVSEYPVILYDNPRAARNLLETCTIERLARNPNVIGLKISDPNVLRWQQILRADIPFERFSIFCGVENMMGLALQLGFDGIVGGLHNIIPNLALKMWALSRLQDWPEVDKVQMQINRVLKVFELDGGWRGLEVAFNYMGICNKVTIHPHDIPIDPEIAACILDILEAEDVFRPFPSPSKSLG